MSDPLREQALERLIESEIRNSGNRISAEPAAGGAVAVLLPGCIVVTLPRGEAIRFSQELIRAIAAGEPTWEGFD